MIISCLFLFLLCIYPVFSQYGYGNTDYCNFSPLKEVYNKKDGLFKSFPNLFEELFETVSIVSVIRHGDRTTLFPDILQNNTYRMDHGSYFNMEAASKKKILKNYRLILETDNEKNNQIDVGILYHFSYSFL